MAYNSSKANKLINYEDLNEYNTKIKQYISTHGGGSITKTSEHNNDLPQGSDAENYDFCIVDSGVKDYTIGTGNPTTVEAWDGDVFIKANLDDLDNGWFDVIWIKIGGWDTRDIQFENNILTFIDSNGNETADIEDIATLADLENLPKPMQFKGSLGTGGTISTLPSASASNNGFTYKVITAGTYASQSAKIGDTFISDGTQWVLIPSGDEPSGTVTSITAGTGLLGGTITSSGTISADVASIADIDALFT